MTTETNAGVFLSFQLYVAGEGRMKRKMSFYWERLFPSQHCDSTEGWSHAPVRISWRGSAPDRVCRDAARAQELGGCPGRAQEEVLLQVVQSGDIIRPSIETLSAQEDDSTLDSVWGIVVWNMHLFCTVLYLISYVFITQWVCGQIPKLYNLMQSHIYKKVAFTDRETPHLYRKWVQHRPQLIVFSVFPQ